MRMFRKQVRKITESGFLKSVFVLAGGTAFAQAISILVMPLLTRLYSPEDFGVLAVYSAIVMILGVVSCLRFDIAIPLPRDDKDAVGLLVIAMMSTIVVSGVVAIAIWLFSSAIESWSMSRLNEYLWLIPIGILAAGFYSSLQCWMIRKKKFKIVAKTRMLQSISASSAQVGFGFLGVAPLGLLFGQVLQTGTGIYGLAKEFIKKERDNVVSVNLVRLKHLFGEYKRFPIYSTWESLANSSAIQLPIILIAVMLADAEAGFLMLAMRLLAMPMSLIGGAVAQVFLAEAAIQYHNRNLKTFTYKTIAQLAKAGIVPLLLAGVTAPLLVPYLFGENWTRTGELISWMVPWFFMQFITSPISMSLHVAGAQKAALYLQIAGFLIRVGAVLVFSVYASRWVVEAYALSGFVFYAIYMLVIVKVLEKTPRR